MTGRAVQLLGQIGLVSSETNAQSLFEFSEHESRTCVLQHEVDLVLQDVFDLLSDVVRRGLLTVEVRRNGSGITSLVVQSSSIVGFATSSNGAGERVFVRVQPKVGTLRMLELAILAGMLPKWRPGGADISPAIDEALLEWTLGAFDESLRQLLSNGGLRSTHERVSADLKNRLRGRLLPGRWLANAAKGKPNVLPAEFPSLEFDNPVNRLLRWAIRTGITVAQSTDRTKGIAERLRQKDRKFAAVTLVKPRMLSTDAGKLPTNLRHYADAMSLALQIIKDVRLGMRPGEVEAMAIALDMDDIYERAFFKGLMQHRPDATRHEAWNVTFSTSEVAGQGTRRRSTEMIPDVWIPGAQSRLPVVIDTKWKNLEYKKKRVERADLLGRNETKTIKLRPEDLYQATAYAIEAVHRSLWNGHACDGCVAVLVYPAITGFPDYGRVIQLGPFKIMIRIVAWNVTESPIEEIGNIWKRVEEVAVRCAPQDS